MDATTVPRQLNVERMFFSTNSAGTININTRKNDVGSLPHTMYKYYSKWIKHLNVQATIIKVLEGKVGVNLHHLGETMLS